MGKSDLLRVGEVRDAFRLIGECRDLGGDPALWCRRLAEGMNRLIGTYASVGEGWAPQGDRGVTPLCAFDSGLDARDGEILGAYIRDGGPAADPLIAGFEYVLGRAVTGTRTQVVPGAAYFRSPVYDRYLRPANIHHRLLSVYQVSATTPFNVIHLGRAPGERDFSPREQRLLNLLHQELGPLVGRALVSGAEASPDDLPPRLRQTLVCLLDGSGEKQVADRLGLSLPTAHQYVTALYRRFGVRSRAQLMAYALKRSGRPPWRQLVSSV
jgi:DNA-binding CsgD family transcriptional regulator